MTRRTQIKKDLIAILKQARFETLPNVLQKYKESDLISPLYSALYNQEEIVRWRAVDAFGLVVDRMARKDMETARVVMRRFLWSLNDESGGIGWGAPEAMAEIMAINHALFKEYGHMLLSYMHEDGPEPFQDGNYIELPELQRGVIWGVGRLADIYRKNLIEKEVVSDLLPYLHSSDAVVRGMTVWTLGNLRDVSSKAKVQKLLTDKGILSVYDKGVITRTTVSDLAMQILAAMGNNV